MQVTARAVQRLRKRLGVTQRQAAEAHEDDITYQYWAMNETGKVPGVVKPATQRKLLRALSRAADMPEDLTLEDLSHEMGADGGRDLGTATQALPRPVRGRLTRHAVFPTSSGDVEFTFPAEMTPEGFREMEAYFKVFVQAHTLKDPPS